MVIICVLLTHRNTNGYETTNYEICKFVQNSYFVGISKECQLIHVCSIYQIQLKINVIDNTPASIINFATLLRKP